MQRREEVEGAGDRVGEISAWQILNSERTANTLSGTDSSRLVKKLWSQVLLETERNNNNNNNNYIDKGVGCDWECVFGLCLYEYVCMLLYCVNHMYACASEEGFQGKG